MIGTVIIGIYLLSNGWSVRGFSLGPVELGPNNTAEFTRAFEIVPTQVRDSSTPILSTNVKVTAPHITQAPINTFTSTSFPSPVSTNTPISSATPFPSPVSTNTPVPPATYTKIPLPTITKVPTLVPTLTLAPTLFSQTVNIPNTGSYGYVLILNSKLQAGTTLQLSYNLVSGDPTKVDFQFYKGDFFVLSIISLDGQGSYSNSFRIDETATYQLPFRANYQGQS